ncbi:MAG TPA: hypothetical protein VE687_00015 [Stellaceae bacterium]|nr:hypothetical protein [Stellaceae bacterium]
MDPPLVGGTGGANSDIFPASTPSAAPVTRIRDGDAVPTQLSRSDSAANGPDGASTALVIADDERLLRADIGGPVNARGGLSAPISLKSVGSLTLSGRPSNWPTVCFENALP